MFLQKYNTIFEFHLRIENNGRKREHRVSRAKISKTLTFRRAAPEKTL